MEVKEVRCYNQEKNMFKDFPEHIVTERFSKSTGYVRYVEPKEPEVEKHQYTIEDNKIAPVEKPKRRRSSKQK